MTEKEMQQKILETAVKTLDAKKAEDIQVIGIKDLTIIADYFVIGSGTSTTHTRTLADEIEFRLGEELAVKPRQIQGNNGSNWIILDYSDIVIHVFSQEMRDFYKLERLWQDGEQVDISKWLK